MRYDYPKSKKDANVFYPISEAELAALIRTSTGRVLSTTLPAEYVKIDLNRRDIEGYVGWIRSVTEPMRLQRDLAADLVGAPA